VDTSGYLDVVDTVNPPIVADHSTIGSQTAPFLVSTNLASKRYQWMAFGGDPAADPTLAFAAGSDTPAGSVQLEQSALADGSVRGEVTANRTAVVLLKASYDPGWLARLDGVDVRPQMIAPALLGVPVGPGHHTVSFRYVPYRFYPLLIGLGLLTLIGLAISSRLLRRARFGPLP
jgi:hypothetical protein